MKLALIAMCLIMAGCAVGSGSETPTEVEVVTTIPPPKPRPDPAPPVESELTEHIDCVIDDYWVGNCYVVKIYCKDRPV